MGQNSRSCDPKTLNLDNTLVYISVLRSRHFFGRLLKSEFLEATPDPSVAEPEPIFLLVGAVAALFKAAPATSFRLAKTKSLALVSNITLTL